MPLSIVLVSASLLLAVPVSLLLFLVSLQAIGPWRRSVKGAQLPDLSDDLLWPEHGLQGHPPLLRR